MSQTPSNTVKPNAWNGTLMFVILAALCISVVFGLRAFANMSAANIISIDLKGFSTDTNGVRIVKTSDGNRFPLTSTFIVKYGYDGSAGPAFMAGHTNVAGDAMVFESDVAITIGKGQQQLLQITKPKLGRGVHTSSITILLYTFNSDRKTKNILASKTISTEIEWPSENYADESIDPKKALAAALKNGIDTTLNGARQNIDIHNDLAKARQMIDMVLQSDPNNANAYVELARVAIADASKKDETARSAALDEAFRLIQIARKKEPDNASATNLLGFVYGAQNKTQEAIAELRKVEHLVGEDLSIIFNWGFALENDNQIAEAIKKYEEGIALAPLKKEFITHANNNAFRRIFDQLLSIYIRKNDMKAIDFLYKRRITVLNEACERTQYAEFKLYRLGDYDAAIELGTRAQEQDCRAGARPILAAAYLTKWVKDRHKLNDEDAEILINRGQAYISNTQQTIVSLALSPRTRETISRLKEMGIKIDSLGADGMTALAVTASKGELIAAQLLLENGANPNAILKDDWTPLMITVVSDDLKVARLLIKYKADRSKKNKQGQTAESLAIEIGNPEMLKLLGREETI